MQHQKIYHKLYCQWLSHPESVQKLRDTYKTLLGDLQCSADERAATAVAKLLEQGT